MIFEGALLGALVRLALSLLAAGLGVFVLFRGRRMPWLFSGAAAFLLGLLVVRILDRILGTGTASTDGLTWQDIVPAAAAVLGALAAQYRRPVAYALIGLATGGALAIWIVQLTQPPDFALDFWSALGILIVMGLGMLFVFRFGDVALIILSAGVGASLIVHALNLPTDSLLVSALALAAAIASLVIQYHDYLVELRAAHRIAEMSDALPPGSEDGAESPVPLPAQ
jgi:hypothetical protein